MSTATASWTSTPGSPSSPPATPIPMSTRRSMPRSTTSCTTARATSTCPPTPTSASGSPVSRRWPDRPGRSSANSGTEAVEAALKLARHHTGRPNAIAFLGGFHGRSLGSLSLTASKARQRAGFGILTPGSFHAPYWDPYGSRLRRRGPSTSSRSCSRSSPIQQTSLPCSSNRSRAKAATSSRRRAGSPTCARSATATRSCSCSTRCSPASDARARCGRVSTTVSNQTSCASARDWPAACRSPASSPAAS